MSGSEYVIVAYAVGLGLLWGYAAVLWMGSRSVAKREQGEGEAL